MLHVAMFEAVNAIDRKYSPYKLSLAADRNTSKEAAAASSGYEVLLALHPDRKAELDAALAAMLAAVPESDSKRAGIELGKTAAAEILVLRSKDGINVQETENIVFDGANAAIARIHLDSPPSGEVLDAIKTNSQDIIEMSLLKL